MVFINYAFLVLIVLSAVAYLFFKTKQFRSTLPIRRKWYKAKAGVALGLLVLTFGLNTGLQFQDAVGIIITVLFFVIGFALARNQYKRVQHEGKFIQEEYELNK